MNSIDPNTSSQQLDLENISEEEYQNKQAERLSKAVFNGDENAEKTGGLISQFVASYEQHKNEVPLQEWLVSEFRKHPGIWANDAEIESTSKDIITSVEAANAARASLYTDLDKGKSRESWLAKRIEEGAAAVGVTQVGLYAENIDIELLKANINSFDAIYNLKEDIVGDWEVSANPHMHGFIAEVDVANQFNLNASASHAGVSAEVVNSTGLNSADLVIKDSTGKILQEIQIKSYANTNQAINNIRSHGYKSGTTLLVHEDQVERLRQEFPDLNVTSSLKAGGVNVDMTSYEKLKKLQYDAQMREESRQYEWNDVNRINIAKGIGKQALLGAGIAAGMQGISILSRRAWNAIKGKENPPASEDLKEFFESSIKSAKHVGIQVAVSGAVVVAVKNGWMGKLLKGTPAGRIANIVYVGMQNAKVLYKFAKGELSGAEAVDAMASTTASTVGGIYGAGIGMAEGAAIGTLFGPVGTVVGGFVGGVIGSMAGSKIAEIYYKGYKAIAKTAVSVIKTVFNGVKETASSLFNSFKELFA